MKFIISILVGCLVFIFMLLAIAKSSVALNKDTNILQECINKNGTIIPRTYLCIKNESLIKLENLK